MRFLVQVNLCVRVCDLWSFQPAPNVTRRTINESTTLWTTRRDVHNVFVLVHKDIGSSRALTDRWHSSLDAGDRQPLLVQVPPWNTLIDSVLGPDAANTHKGVQEKGSIERSKGGR